MENCIPEFWEREWKIAFPTFGNGNEKIIPNFREREWEAGIPGNGREREFLLTPATRLKRSTRLKKKAGQQKRGISTNVNISDHIISINKIAQMFKIYSSCTKRYCCAQLDMN